MDKEDLTAAIIEIGTDLRNEFKLKWKRTLPFQDQLFDRWERAKYLGFGEGTSIYESAFVFGDVEVGKNTWIGMNVILDGSRGKIKIGDNCSISAGVHIYSHDSVQCATSGGKKAYETGDVRIGDCCYIAPYVVVKRGVTIGNHCVVGVHSYVNRDVEDFTIVAGVPAKKIGTVKV
jgi:acetyltransferase-like isoleucine patch superfamily enzyme